MPKFEGYPWKNGTSNWIRDVLSPLNTKSYTVPAGKIRVYDYIAAQLSTSADAGNRRFCVLILDATGNILHQPAYTPAVVASKKAVVLLFPSASYSVTATVVHRLDAFTDPDIALMDSVPAYHLSAGETLKIYDQANVAAAADSMVIALHYMEYDA